MSTHSRKHSDATQIAEEILKAAAKPRQPASVKEALKKKKPPVPVPLQTLGGNKGRKTRVATARVSR